MAVRGRSDVQRNFSRLIGQIRGRMSKQAVEQILIAGEGHAASMTPVDTSNLINSRYRDLKKTESGYRGMAGYTARYAAAVHDAPGKLKGQPRAHFGRTREGVEFGGGTLTGKYWDPHAEPEFLRKGFEDEDTKSQIQEILRREYRL